MQLISGVDPIYLPEADQQTILRLGLRNIDISEWLHIDEDFSQFQQHKLQQEKLRRDKVFAANKHSADAQLEFSLFLKHHLLTHWPDQFREDGNQLMHLESALSWPSATTSLWESSLWIQDDICLLEATGGHHVMTAASLCSPSNWKLEDKIDQTVDWIHEPVPGYQDLLADRVNKLLAGLKPGKPVLRFNWSIQEGNELCWREDVNGNGNDELFWRVERQTLLKLPETGAIVFAIRIFLHDFETMGATSSFYPNLQTVLSQQAGETLSYKSIPYRLLERLQGK